ncbi:cytochrome c oxidase subunit 3 [Eisenibacter elegans]|jgi:cytochrome c oxidase subunit 3|uniref:cytochrome c oxidase subunit 3 n=1 Tax=Eisenibacter elegans TaxID=997 RepID=UPI0003F6167D|nr:cytochrome c oxidase subunit 3 [Eisenibacter elegans]
MQEEENQYPKFSDLEPQERPEKGLFRRREPLQFLLWLAIFSMSLGFFSLTATYVYKRIQGVWTRFDLPPAFWLSTAVIMASSYTLYLANVAFQEEQFKRFRSYILFTLSLGIGFMVLQAEGWRELIVQGVWLKGAVSGSFVYVLSGLHMAHLAGGVIFLMVILIEAVRHTSYVDSFVYSVNPPNQLRLKLLTIYWHFVDVLWLYLFVFLLLNHWL